MREPDDRRPQVRAGVVPELRNHRVSFERGLDDSALYAAPSAVYDADLSKARASSRSDVLLDHDRHVPGVKGVEIELRFDRKDVNGRSDSTVVAADYGFDRHGILQSTGHDAESLEG